jgi:hypothetical protein
MRSSKKTSMVIVWKKRKSIKKKNIVTMWKKEVTWNSPITNLVPLQVRSPTSSLGSELKYTTKETFHQAQGTKKNTKSVVAMFS